jgi:hypothetical protein
MSAFGDGDLLYDRAEVDATGELRNRAAGPAGKAEVDEMVDLLVEAMRAIEAPDEQLARLGIGG